MNDFSDKESSKKIYMAVEITVYGKNENCAHTVLKAMRELRLTVSTNVRLREACWEEDRGDSEEISSLLDHHNSIEELQAAYPDLVAKMRLL